MLPLNLQQPTNRIVLALFHKIVSAIPWCLDLQTVTEKIKQEEE